MAKGKKMEKRVFLMMALVLMIAVSSYAYDDGDFQVWNTGILIIRPIPGGTATR